MRRGWSRATRSISSAATTSSPTAPTISPRAISCPTPASSRRSRWSPPRSACSTARSPRCAPTSAGPTERPIPTYRCLFPEPPPPGSVPACAEAGILGALTGVLGSLMALEVIREIVGFGEGLVGRLVMLDARSMRFETLQYAWDPANPLSGEHPTIKRFVDSRRTAVQPSAIASGQLRPSHFVRSSASVSFVRLTSSRSRPWSCPSSPTICCRRRCSMR